MSVSTRVRRLLPAAALILLGSVTLVAGCSDDEPSGPGNSPKFDPAQVTIVIGDTIRWTAVSGDHTVTSGTGSSDPNAGDLFDEELPDGDTYTRVFSTVGTFDYFCIPHEADGMKGKVIVTAIDIDTVHITASGSSFGPKNVQINVGDAVRWTSNGSHTVTSGTGSADPDAGLEFEKDPLLNGQTFIVVFDQVGTYPYFCEIHENMGMTGTITVVEDTRQTVEVDATE